MAHLPKNISGEKFYRLTAIKFFERRGNFDYWLFKCQCGSEVVYRKNNVTSVRGKTKSCGCLNQEQQKTNGKKNKTHGMSDTRIYYVWKSMNARCNYPKTDHYKYYGARGIRVEWKCFEDFISDMYELYILHIKQYGQKNTQIDRFNVNGNYSKKNCRWVTIKEQANNKRVKMNATT